MNLVFNSLSVLFNNWSGQNPESVIPLPVSGSARRYFRMQCGSCSAIGVYNPIAEENNTFFAFTRHFKKYELPVPELLEFDLENNVYLLSDLGTTSLFDVLTDENIRKSNFSSVIPIMEGVIKDLIRFQVVAGESLDYNQCYGRKQFDSNALLWDMYYFKYYFLRPGDILFDEYKLEKDFQELTGYLLKADMNYFMYRDFQSRNIMIKDEKPYYIDYQGGFKGPLQYDLVSFLFQAKAQLPPGFRSELIDFYLAGLNTYMFVDRDNFLSYFDAYTLIRLLQVLGAYGYRGLFEGKPHFLQSIPYAINNIKWFIQNVNLQIKVPSILDALKRIIDSSLIDQLPVPSYNDAGLTVSVNSFSYKKSLPVDYSGNGGGFVFDCRALPNPGRMEKYRFYTGRNIVVQDYLQEFDEVDDFLNNAFKIVDSAVQNYLKRGFKHLMVNFGCTGGQHRSVYCAEKLSEHLNKMASLNVNLMHQQKGNWIVKETEENE